jgi:DNA-binding SARP family transcriptional activator
MVPPARNPLPAFRHEAPDLEPATVERSRLLARLAGRFDRRLTVLTAGAGFGKTTLLADAVVRNAGSPAGADVWLRLEAADQDPVHLLAGLLRSAGSSTAGLSAPSVDDVVEVVWARSPTPVAIVLDRTEALGSDPAAWAPLVHLLDRLPRNGHLVVAGRRDPMLPAHRLLAAGEADLLTEADLAFTAEELLELGAHHDLTPDLAARLPAWPALAELTGRAGPEASVGFVWDEVLSRLPEQRRSLFARAILFDLVDDVVAAAVADEPGWSAARVVEGLPLVDADGKGSYRPSELWAAALADALTPAQRVDALRRGGAALLEDRQHARALAAFAAAGDLHGAHRTVRSFVGQPIAAVTVPDVVALLDHLPEPLRDAPIGLLLAAARHWGTGHEAATEHYERAVEAAIVAQDDEVEALARWRLVQLYYLDDHDRLVLDDRTHALARPEIPLGASTAAFVRSVQAQRRGDVEAALAALTSLDGFNPDQRLTTMAARLIDLGRPESVGVSVDVAVGPGAPDVFGGQAVWLRGDVDPETAWAIAARLPGLAGRQGVLHEQVSIRCVVATIALAAGAEEAAADLVAQARADAGAVGRQVRLMVLVADALVALSVDGEDAARPLLEVALAEQPLGSWPARAHLHGLAAIRALAPGSEVLDHCDLGRSLRTAVDAGRALVALRAGDPTAVDGLPWSDPDLLRCQVPPALLAELALARSLAGGPAGEQGTELLDALPHQRRWLARVATSGPGEVGAAARQRLATLPERPPFDLHLRVLGPVEISRSDGAPVPDGWRARERVRQVLVRLVLARSVARAELAAELWPDLPPDKAAANLRVNLRHLQQALQPDRSADAPPWFVHTEGTVLTLATEGVTIDLDHFDGLVERAVQAEAAGTPSVALAEYEAALELYAGDLFEGLDDPAVVMERLRVRSVAHGAQCRRGELLLARGEPEAAMRVAVEAERLDALSERAHRLFIRCHLALGSSAAARSAGTRLLGLLTRHELRPDDETRLLLQRLQV